MPSELARAGVRPCPDRPRAHRDIWDPFTLQSKYLIPCQSTGKNSFQ